MSTVESPIKMGDKGTVGIDNYDSTTKKTKTENAYITIKKFSKGEDAIKLIKEYEYSDIILKEDLEEDTDYGVVEYDVDLKDYTNEREGTIRFSIYARGLDGNSVKYNNASYIIFTSNLTNYDDKLGKEGDILHMRELVPIPKGFKEDFLLQFEWNIDGDYNNKGNTYFLVEND